MTVSWLTAMASLVTIAGLWWLYMLLFKDYWRDLFRQRLFALRDEMFDYCADNDLPWETEAYTFLRSAMNGFIRFADRLSFTVPVIAALCGTLKVDKTFGARLSEALAALPEPHRAAFQQFSKRMQREVISLLFRNSLLVGVLLLPAMVVLARRTSGSRTASRDRVTVCVPGMDRLALDAALDDAELREAVPA